MQTTSHSICKSFIHVFVYVGKLNSSVCPSPFRISHSFFFCPKFVPGWTEWFCSSHEGCRSLYCVFIDNIVHRIAGLVRRVSLRVFCFISPGRSLGTLVTLVQEKSASRSSLFSGLSSITSPSETRRKERSHREISGSERV